VCPDAGRGPQWSRYFVQNESLTRGMVGDAVYVGPVQIRQRMASPNQY
jgi:hypothetical protein